MIGEHQPFCFLPEKIGRFVFWSCWSKNDWLMGLKCIGDQLKLVADETLERLDEGETHMTPAWIGSSGFTSWRSNASCFSFDTDTAYRYPAKLNMDERQEVPEFMKDFLFVINSCFFLFLFPHHIQAGCGVGSRESGSTHSIIITSHPLWRLSVITLGSYLRW